jgi:hypothetical protein
MVRDDVMGDIGKLRKLGTRGVIGLAILATKKRLSTSCQLPGQSKLPTQTASARFNQEFA